MSFHGPVFSSYTASSLCRYSGSRPFILAAVPSVVSHTEQRKAIRETWGSVAYGIAWPGGQVYPRGSVKIVFVFGRSKTPEEDIVLQEESAYYGDIVQADFEDSYGNLSLKTLTILRWMTIYCPLAKHLLKVDEDTFVNLPLLLHLLATVSSLNYTRYIIGFIYTSQPSKVLRQGKWAVPPRLYPAQYYPYYTVGHSYVISGDCIQDLTSACRHFRLLAIEDAFFTGIVARALNITRLHCRLFASRLRKVPECSVISRGYVAETLCNADKLRRLWMLMQGNKCSSTGSGKEEDKDVAVSVES